MKRTQIYLDEDLFYALRVQSRALGISISDLIRKVLRKKLSVKGNTASAIDNFAGIWSDQDYDVDKHIRTLRTNSRLKRLYEE